MESDPESHPYGYYSFQAGDTRVFEQAECKPELARECTCDTLHPEGFVPTNATLLRRGVAASAGSQPHIFPGVGREAGLECDKEMMHQMAKSGTDSHSRATWAGTVTMSLLPLSMQLLLRVGQAEARPPPKTLQQGEVAAGVGRFHCG